MSFNINSDKEKIRGVNPSLIGNNELTIRGGTGSDEKEILRTELNSDGFARVGINRTGQKVNNITVTAGGTGYSSPPAVTLIGGGGSGATATAFTPTVDQASCAAFLIVLTGFTAERPSFKSEPICAETYMRPPTSFVARLRTYSVVAILSDLSPSSGVIERGNSPESPVSENLYFAGSITLKPICLNDTVPFSSTPSTWDGAEELVCPEFNA